MRNYLLLHPTHLVDARKGRVIFYSNIPKSFNPASDQSIGPRVVVIRVVDLRPRGRGFEAC